MEEQKTLCDFCGSDSASRQSMCTEIITNFRKKGITILTNAVECVIMEIIKA